MLIFMIVKMLDREARRCVVAGVARGLITIPEAAMLAGVSHQVVRYWCRRINWKRVRHRRISDWWTRAMKRGAAGRRL